MSTVPKSKSPDEALVRAPSTLSSIHANFVAEKYGSRTSPVFCDIIFSRPFDLRMSQVFVVLRSCHTIAGLIAFPVFLFHTSVVSRWLAIPIDAISLAFRLTFLIALRTVSITEFQISSGSCSTQPGCGKYCSNSCWAIDMIEKF